MDEKYQEDSNAIKRRQRIAEMLMAQGAEPLETNQMAGGYVVPVSPLAGIAKVAQQLSGAYIGRKADEREAKLEQDQANALMGIDFNAPDAPAQLAKIGRTKEGIALALHRAKGSAGNSGTPGQWYIPPGAKEETFGGVQGFRAPDGSFIPSRAAMTEYQQAMTSPSNRAQVTAAVEGQKLHKTTNPEGRDFYGRGTDITGGAVPDLAQPQPPQSSVNMSMTIKPSMMQHLIDVWGSPENAVAEIKRNPGAYADKEYGQAAPAQQVKGPIMGPSMQEKAALDVDTTQAKKEAENRAAAKAALPSIIDSATYTNDLLEGLKSHPGLSGVVGVPSIKSLLNVPATPEADFKARLDQIKGRQFLEAFNSLKGGGQITEVEGKKATEAIGRMQTSQSEKEFIDAATELQGIINKAKATAEQKAGIATEQAPKSPTGAPITINSDEEYNALPSGTEFVSPDGKRRRKP